MSTVLFISEDSPIPSAIAAAFLRSMNVESIRAQAAAGREARPDENLLRILAETGLEWPEEIFSPSSITWFSYDLVVCFSNKSSSVLPPLPGNPAVLYWNVPTPVSSRRSDPAALRLLRDRICGLVHDLIEQGYLSALVQAEKNAELVMDNLHEGIIAHDMNRTIFFFNRAAERITGYSRKEILGRDCHDVFPGGFCAKSCSFCDPDYGPGLPHGPYPLVFKTSSGESRQVEMSIVQIRDNHGDPVGIVGSFRDMTRELELAARLGEIEQFSGIIGRDPAMLEIFETVRYLADSNVPVHIQGESGTGKELVAAAIHNEGNRADKRFVPVNCGALPENLLESELFGHVKGAFTGAIRDNFRKHSRPVQMTSRGKRRKKLEIKAVCQAIEETNNNRVRAAKLLGVSRATLYRFLAEHPLD